ncbi:MAG: CRISPR-associated endoribonuclease Cas6 [Firmicutes bacterium]|nr:CRISPR-associated endoribonuclease Cas6 [Bacillota bacterium]
MLQKYTFIMTCREPGAVRGLGGAEAHGLLFSLLKEVDEAATTSLHNAVEKPFALGVPTGTWNRERDFSLSNEGEMYSFTVSCLTPEMSSLVEQAAAAWQGRNVRLGNGVFSGEEITIEFPSGVQYQDILTRPRLPGEINLEFRTPTSFRQRGNQILFPLPERVFGSLLQRWNSFSPLKLPENTDFSLVRVKRYTLRTEMVIFERYMVAGFVGRCAYNLPGKYDDLLAFQVHTLARFAEFAGVGYKVTMGLGEVSLI